MCKIIVILLLIASMCTTEAALQRRKPFNTRRAGPSKTHTRRFNSRGGRFSDQTENSDHREVDDSEDYRSHAAERFDHDSTESRHIESSSLQGKRFDPSTDSSNRHTVESSEAESLEKGVNETDSNITFEDFSVENEDLRAYVNKLRKRIIRLQKIKGKFSKLQCNYILRYRMDTIETKYLNNIKFVEENQDYNQTLLKLIPTFNDKRKAIGWTQMVDITKITVTEVVKSEARKDRFVFRDLPKTFLTRYEKWYAGTEWLQSLSSERVTQLKTSDSVFYQMRKSMLEQFQERPIISSSEIGTGMDNLYGIISANVKTCLEISNLGIHKIPKKPLTSYKRNETVLKCANVLESLKI